MINGAGAALTVAEPLPGLKIAFDVEPLGLVFALLASLLWIVTSVYAIGYMRGADEPRQTSFFAFFAIAISGAMGVATSGNLLTLFIFYEMLTLSTWPLVTHKQNDAARAGGRTYMGVLLTTSIGLLLPAIIWTWVAAGTTDFTPGRHPARQPRPHRGRDPADDVRARHRQGRGHADAPLAAGRDGRADAGLGAAARRGGRQGRRVHDHQGGHLHLRTRLPGGRAAGEVPGLPGRLHHRGRIVVALKQVEIKKMLAYSTISQLSYIVLAALVLAPYAEIGAAVHIVAHAFGKITLFFCAGAIYIASSKTRVDQLRGIGRRMPWTMAAFTIAALSMIGVPPTAGFVSKWYIIAGAFQVDSVFVLLVMGASTALNAAYFLPIVFRAFFKQEDEASRRSDHAEAPWPMVAALT